MGNGYLNRVSPITDRELLQVQIIERQIQIMIVAVLFYKGTNGGHFRFTNLVNTI